MVTTAVTPTVTRGHKKKARTRRLLLDVARVVVAERGEGFSIADIVGRADVSQGTFYNYFADRDALMGALAADIVETFAGESALLVDEPDPVARFALISARALEAALSAPDVVRVALRVESAQRALVTDGPVAHLRHDLTEAHEQGRIALPADDATLDVVVGALLLASRRIIDGETSPDYRRAVIQRLLLTLGVASAEAVALANRAVP